MLWMSMTFFLSCYAIRSKKNVVDSPFGLWFYGLTSPSSVVEKEHLGFRCISEVDRWLRLKGAECIRASARQNLQ